MNKLGVAKLKPLTVRLLIWQAVTFLLAVLWVLNDTQSAAGAVVLLLSPSVVSLVVAQLSLRRSIGVNRETKGFQYGLLIGTAVILTIVGIYLLVVGRPAINHAHDVEGEARVALAATQLLYAAQKAAADSGGSYPPTLYDIIRSGDISLESLEPLKMDMNGPSSTIGSSSAGRAMDAASVEAVSQFIYYGRSRKMGSDPSFVLVVSKNILSDGRRLLVTEGGDPVWLSAEDFKKIEARIEARQNVDLKLPN